MNRADQVRSREIAESHAHLTGEFFDIQLRLLAHEAQWFRQIVKLDHAGVGTGNGHLAFHVLQVHVRAAALQVEQSLDAYRAHHVAAPQIDARVPADVLQAHTRVVGNNLHIAGDVGDIEIAVAAVRFDGRALGNRNFHVGVHAHAVAGQAVLVVLDGDGVGVAGDLKRHFLIGVVGALLVQAANRPVSGHLHRIGVRAGDASVAAETFQHHARRLRNLLLTLKGKLVALAEHIEPADGHVARPPRVESTDRMQACAEHAQENHQHPFAARNSGARQRFVGGAPEQHLGQPEHAPHDQQERPVFRQIVEQRNVRIQIPRQK